METKKKPRAIIFVDGQNLFRCAKEAFNVTHPNYDIDKLSKLVAGTLDWEISKIKFYTGVPEAKDDKFWNEFWSKKWLTMSRQKIDLFKRNIRFRDATIKCPEHHEFTERVGHEKGIDVRIAIDIIRAAASKSYDAMLIFSQDQDLSEAVIEVKRIAAEQGRFILLHSAFPVSGTTKNKIGIQGTNWFKITEYEYSKCIDENDYRPKQKKLTFR